MHEGRNEWLADLKTDRLTDCFSVKRKTVKGSPMHASRLEPNIDIRWACYCIFIQIEFPSVNLP